MAALALVRRTSAALSDTPEGLFFSPPDTSGYFAGGEAGTARAATASGWVCICEPTRQRTGAHSTQDHDDIGRILAMCDGATVLFPAVEVAQAQVENVEDRPIDADSR